MKMNDDMKAKIRTRLENSTSKMEVANSEQITIYTKYTGYDSYWGIEYLLLEDETTVLFQIINPIYKGIWQIEPWDEFVNIVQGVYECLQKTGIKDEDLFDWEVEE